MDTAPKWVLSGSYMAPKTIGEKPPVIDTPDLDDKLAEYGMEGPDDGPEQDGDSPHDEGAEDGRGSAASAPARLADPISPKPKAEATEPSQDGEAGSDEGDSEEPPSTPQRTEEDAKALADALQVLRRARISDKLISKMGDDELLEQAEALRPSIKERDDLFRRLGERSKAPTGEGEESGAESTRGGEPSAERPAADDLPDLAPVLKSLGLDGDEDAEKSLAGFARSLVEQTARHFAPVSQEVSYLRGELAATVAQSVFTELVGTGRYDQLKESPVQHRVESKAVALLQSPAYGGNLRRALQDAVRIELGAGADVPDPEARKRAERARRRGNPDLPTGSRRERPRTQEDVLDANLDAKMAEYGIA